MKQINCVDYPKDHLYIDYSKSKNLTSISMNTVLVNLDLQRVQKLIEILQEIEKEMKK